MKNILRLGFLTLACAFIFGASNSANAQNRGRNQEVRQERREARKDYRQDVRKARKEYRQDVREARKDYRHDSGRRINRGYYISRSRRAYPQRYRVYYRNGRRYVRNY